MTQTQSQTSELPKSQKPKTYHLQEKTSDGRWTSIWKVQDMPKVAGRKFDRVKGKEETEYRLVESWKEGSTRKEEVIMREVN